MSSRSPRANRRNNLKYKGFATLPALEIPKESKTNAPNTDTSEKEEREKYPFVGGSKFLQLCFVDRSTSDRERETGKEVEVRATCHTKKQGEETNKVPGTEAW